jgi:hypothetical protein
MVIEDDAELLTDGSRNFQQFVESLPVDWRLLILGGQHAHQPMGLPVPESSSVYRPYSIANPNALLWRGFPMLRDLYRFSLACANNPHGPWDYSHVRRPRSRGIYVPANWVFRRSESDTRNSSTTGCAKPSGAAEIFEQPCDSRVVAVLACYRGGSSCVAGALHHLGVSMGLQFLPPDRMNPRGYYECLQLWRLTRRIFDHPSMARRLPKLQIVGLLRQWAARRSGAAHESTDWIGAKHPSLCCLGHEVRQAWHNPVFVVVDRQPSEIIASILRTNWGWSREEAAINVETLLAEREQFLSTCSSDEFIRIDFQKLRNSPRKLLSEIADFLALPAAGPLIEAAANHIDS